MKIVFFGDSVTEGYFDILKIKGEWITLFDQPSGYASLLSERLKAAHPDLHLEFINSGIAGEGTVEAIGRFERDVLAHDPDLVIMCFELNDIAFRDGARYEKNLRVMYDQLKARGITTVLMSSNMVNKYVAVDTPDYLVNMAKDCADCQNSGVLDTYTEIVSRLAKEYGFYFVDAYAVWKKLDSYGIDTTALLCNHINHPSRKMHNLFADMLFDAIEREGLIH